MFCGRCGNNEVCPVLEETTQNGEYVTVRHYGKCDVCGELLGVEELFQLIRIDPFISRENVKKALDKAGKVCYNKEKMRCVL